MTCCPECGHPLEKKFLKDEGDIPYCSQCASFRFPVFNTAISAILFNEKHDKILLIKQYDMAEHILLAGYVSNDIHNQFLQSLKAINLASLITDMGNKIAQNQSKTLFNKEYTFQHFIVTKKYLNFGSDTKF